MTIILDWLFIIMMLIFIIMFIVFSVPTKPTKRPTLDTLTGIPYGRKREILYLADRIKTGQSSVIIGLFSREKTELLGFLRNENPQQQEALYGDQVGNLIFSYIDVSMLAIDCTPVQLWGMILQPLQGKSETELVKAYQHCQAEQFSRLSLETVISVLNRLGGRLVLLLDAFQDILKHPALANASEFFGTLRALAASRTPSPLVVIATSNQPLTEFHQATKTLNPFGSPYLNFMEGGITILVGLSDFEVDKLLAQVSPTIPTIIQQRIKELAGGNPYLLQVAVSEFLKGGEQIAVDKFEENFFSRMEDGLKRMLEGWDSRLCQAFLALVQGDNLSELKRELENLEDQGFVTKGFVTKGKVDNQWQLRTGIFKKLIVINPQQVWCKQEKV